MNTTLFSGLPSPPTNLNKTVNLEMSYVEFFWQPPLALVIDKNISYILNITVSFLNYTDFYEVMTSNLSYTHDLKEQEHHLCSVSHLSITIFSRNVVGLSKRMQTEILLYSLCTTTTILPESGM